MATLPLLERTRIWRKNERRRRTKRKKKRRRRRRKRKRTKKRKLKRRTRWSRKKRRKTREQDKRRRKRRKGCLSWRAFAAFVQSKHNKKGDETNSNQTSLNQAYRGCFGLKLLLPLAFASS